MKEFLRRLQGRLQHGLLIQEILDRAAKFGLIFYPYLLVVEKPDEAGREAAGPPGFSTRLLTREDISSIAPLIERRRQVPDVDDGLQHRLRSGQLGIGLYSGSEFAGYSWCALDYCTSISRHKLFELNANEAYMFDVYVLPSYRGQGLAIFVRRALFAVLMEQRRCVFYSVSLLFNASTHRFKRRLGSEKMELRLYIRCFGGPARDLLLRRYSSRPPREQSKFVVGQSPTAAD